MKPEYYISSFCKISENRIILNGNVVFEEQPGLTFSDFMKAAYRHFELNYPKFFKMDNLCKLGFMAAELVLKDTGFTQEYQADEIGILIHNASSSIDTDTDYHLTIRDRNNYFPSPALFVYTLPNILIGELCIRHHIKGESSLFITEKPDPEMIQVVAENLLEHGRTRACLTGWVDFNRLSVNKDDVAYEAMVYTVGEKGKSINFEHHIKNIIKLCQS